MRVKILLNSANSASVIIYETANSRSAICEKNINFGGAKFKFSSYGGSMFGMAGAIGSGSGQGSGGSGAGGSGAGYASSGLAMIGNSDF
mgnify:CR=1 FL=1